MFAVDVEGVREKLLGDLSDAAFEVTAEHGTQGSSVEQELELWQALARVVQGVGAKPARREEFVARLTDAAYQVALQRGFAGSFVDLQLDLWHTLCRQVRQNPLTQEVLTFSTAGHLA